MLDQFGTRDHAAGMVHQIAQQAVFVAGERPIAVDRDAPVRVSSRLARN
jgi:hypothetical protein